MTNKPIKISNNCWKHTYKNEDVCYRKTSDPNSKLHREDGPAFEYLDGTKAWWINGKLHRTDGPAIVFTDSSKKWYTDGKLHRENGPACEFANGSKHWYINGKCIDVNSQEEFELYLKNLIFV